MGMYKEYLADVATATAEVMTTLTGEPSIDMEKLVYEAFEDAEYVIPEVEFEKLVLGVASYPPQDYEQGFIRSLANLMHVISAGKYNEQELIEFVSSEFEIAERNPFDMYIQKIVRDAATWQLPENLALLTNRNREITDGWEYIHELEAELRELKAKLVKAA